MIFPHIALVSALVIAVTAELRIFSPGSQVWWVEKSINTLSWTCKDPAAPETFTVLIANKDQKVLTDPLPIIGIQNNFDCSKTITQDQLSAPPGTGYTIQFGSTLNRSSIYATSEEFEIKPVGSTYPTVTPGLDATSSSAGSSTQSSTSSQVSTTPNAASPRLAVSCVIMGAVLGGAAIALSGF